MPSKIKRNYRAKAKKPNSKKSKNNTMLLVTSVAVALFMVVAVLVMTNLDSSQLKTSLVAESCDPKSGHFKTGSVFGFSSSDNLTKPGAKREAYRDAAGKMRGAMNGALGDAIYAEIAEGKSDQAKAMDCSKDDEGESRDCRQRSEIWPDLNDTEKDGCRLVELNEELDCTYDYEGSGQGPYTAEAECKGRVRCRKICDPLESGSPMPNITKCTGDIFTESGSLCGDPAVAVQKRRIMMPGGRYGIDDINTQQEFDDLILEAKKSAREAAKAEASKDCRDNGPDYMSGLDEDELTDEVCSLVDEDEAPSCVIQEEIPDEACSEEALSLPAWGDEYIQYRGACDYDCKCEWGCVAPPPSDMPPPEEEPTLRPPSDTPAPELGGDTSTDRTTSLDLIDPYTDTSTDSSSTDSGSYSYPGYP